MLFCESTLENLKEKQMSTNKIVAKRIYALAEEIAADTDYVYDPTHQNKPHGGGNWHKTEKGWSTKEENKSNHFTSTLPKSMKERMEMAENIETSKEQLREIYSKHRKNSKFQEALARNYNTPVDILEELGQNGDHHVRLEVADNPSASEQLLTKMMEDSFYKVRDAAIRNLRNR